MKVRTRIGLLIVALALLIAFFEWAANAYYLYWEWWWFDIVMHFLGGLFIASSVGWFLRFEVPLRFQNRLPLFLIFLVVTLFVGVAWEIFERVFDIYSAINYTLDTTTDLFMDIVGMLVAYMLFKKI